MQAVDGIGDPVYSYKTTTLLYLVIARYPCYYMIVIQNFKTKGTEDIFNGVNSREAKRTCPVTLWRVAARKLDQLDSVESINELRIPPGNRLEELTGNRVDQFSVRINDQYRICFLWTVSGPDQVEIVEYH
jgi:proteic killer suppression protein